VLDPDTLLLEYWLGDKASYLFVVSQDTIVSYQLPKREEIELATRQLYELLTASQPGPGETPAQHQARISEARVNYWPRAVTLSRMILGPASSLLGKKRLLIVADGALHYLPFGALPVPESGEAGERGSGRAGNWGSGRAGERGTGRLAFTGRQSKTINRRPLSCSPASPLAPSPTPLIVEHEIINLPSASTLAVLRRELAGREPAPKDIAVLADPVFSPDDARVKGAPLARESEGSDNGTISGLSRALRDVRGGLTRLPMTRDEAQAILSLSPEKARLEALDFRASRATQPECLMFKIIDPASDNELR